MSEQGWLKKTFVHRDYLRPFGGWTDPWKMAVGRLLSFLLGFGNFSGAKCSTSGGWFIYVGVFSKLKPANWEVLIVLRGIGHVRQCCAHLLVIGACRHHLQRHPWMRRSDTARTEHMVVHVAVSAQQARALLYHPWVGWLRQCEDGKTYLHRAWRPGTCRLAQCSCCRPASRHVLPTSSSLAKRLDD